MINWQYLIIIMRHFIPSRQDLPLIIADRRHSLLGHVCRLPPDVPAHNILQHCVNLSQGRCPAPDWKRPPGRPRKTWIQQVEQDHGCTIDSLWSSAQDRSLWRSLRPSLVRRSSEWVSYTKQICWGHKCAYSRQFWKGTFLVSLWKCPANM